MARLERRNSDYQRMKRTTALLVGAIALLVIAAFLWQNFSSREGARPEEDRAVVESNQSPASKPHPPPALVVQYPSAAPRVAPLQPEPTPVKGEAFVELDGRSIQPENNAGQFQRVAVGANETVPIRLSWPEDKTHSDVFVQAVHGGKIDGGGNHKRFTLGADKTVSFAFTPDGGPGSYQIALRRGTTEEVLQFWVPTENPSNDPPTIR